MTVTAMTCTTWAARCSNVLFPCDVPSARPHAGRRSLAGHVAGAPGDRAAVPGILDAPPAARRLLAAWVGVRGLRRDPVPRIRRRRLDRWLYQCHSAPAGA